MAGYQMIELMPRSEWNVKRRRWGTEEESHKVILQNIFRNQIMKEVQQSLPMGTRWEGGPGAHERKLEHCAVDDMDLSCYKPVEVHAEALESAARMAFNNHHPLVLSPDLVYGYLVKGICIHINKFPEQLRKLYVSFDGKKELIYENDFLVMGSKDNDWSDMFRFFASSLKEETKGNSIVQEDLRFSTSTRVTEAHRHVLAMESMKSYFGFKCRTRCGIPSIILEGNETDWRLLKDTITSQLQEINDFCEKNTEAKDASLKWWSPAVEVVLDNFLSTFTANSKGEELSTDMKLWWKTIYKYNEALGSGARATVTGWLNVFYPYINDGKEKKRNPWIVHCAPIIKDKDAIKKHFESYANPFRNNPDACGRVYEADEVEPGNFPSYLATVPYVWDYHGTYHNMNILIGFSMVGQVAGGEATYPKGTLKVFPTWVIYHKDKTPEGKEIKQTFSTE